MGATKIDSLTDSEIKAFLPASKLYKRTDGKGLCLFITPAGGKRWRFSYHFGGKRKTLCIGAYPGVSIAEARATRDLAKQAIKQGIDPATVAKLEKAKRRDEAARQLKTTRFSLDNTGALTAYLGNRVLTLTGKETADLRAFLLATQNLTPEV